MATQTRPTENFNFANAIEEASVHLITCGVATPCFAGNSYRAAGFTDETFFRHLQRFRNLDEIETERILNIGIRLNHFPSVRSLRPRDFYDFLLFLRSEAGQRELDRLDRAAEQRKLERNWVEDVLVSMFHHQRNLIANKENTLRAEMEAKIASIEEEIRRVKEMMEVEEADLLASSPVGEYVPLTNDDRNKRCWAVYVEDLAKINVPEPVQTKELLKEARCVYGEQVRKQHVLEFLDGEGRMERLAQGTSRDIIDADTKGDKRLATRLRDIMRIAGREPPGPESALVVAAENSGDETEAGDQQEHGAVEPRATRAKRAGAGSLEAGADGKKRNTRRQIR